MSGKTRTTIGSILTFVGTVVTYAGNPYFIGTALILIGGALTYDGQKRQQREAERRARAGSRAEGIRANYRGTHDHHLLVFGKARVGGKVLDQETSAGADWENQNYHIRIAHSLCHAGGCVGIGDLWLDDTRVPNGAIVGDPTTGMRDVNLATYGTGMVKLRHWLGTAAQGNDAGMPGSAGAATAYCRGMASTHFELIRVNDDEKMRNVFKYGPPVLNVEQLGIRCYDPRLDSTMGGSGTQRANDPLTWGTVGYDNPALWIGTYLIMSESDGGCGEDQLVTDAEWWASVAAAANESDSAISTPGGNIPKYSGAGLVLSSLDHKSVNLQKMLDCMGPKARLVPINGSTSYRLHASAYRAPTATITQDWLADEGYEIDTRPLDEALYNAVRVNYDDPALDYKTIEAPPYTSSTYEAEDGGDRLWSDLTLPGVKHAYRAQYFAQQHHKASRYQATITLTLNMRAMDLEHWETCNIELPGVDLTGRVWRVAFYKDLGTRIQIVFEEDHASIYTVDAFKTPVASGTSGAAYQVPPLPTSITATPVETGIYIKFTPPKLWTYEVIEVHRATLSGGTFSKIGEVPNGGTFFLDRQTDGATYYYKLRSRNRLSVLSAFSAEVNSGSLQSAQNDLDDIPDGVVYGRPRLTALTSGEVDLARSGVINRTADHISEAPTRKWAAESGAQVVTGKSITLLTDRNLGNIADDATYGRTKLTALTSGEVDLSKSGVLNKSADQIAESGARKWAGESGADVTSGKSINVLTDVKTEPQFFTFTQTITATGAGSVTIPAGARTGVIRAWGGCAAGAKSSPDTSNGGGGGGGGSKKNLVFKNTDWGGTISHSVGPGAAGRNTVGSGSDGTASTITSSGLSFTNLNINAGGGQGGTTSAGGAGGGASGGDTNVSGTAGLFGAPGLGGNHASIDSIVPGKGGNGTDGGTSGAGSNGQVSYTWAG